MLLVYRAPYNVVLRNLLALTVDRLPGRGEIRLVRTVFHLLVRMEPRRKGAATVNTGCLSACIRVKWRVKLRQGGITGLNGNSLDGERLVIKRVRGVDREFYHVCDTAR